MSESIRKVSTIFTIDDNEHNRKLKEINSQYKLTQSEIKLAGERLNSFGKNTDDLKYKQDALSKQTATLIDKVNLYKESIEKASTRAEENNKKLQELKKTKEQLQSQYKEAVKAYGSESEEVQKLKEQLNKVNTEYQEQKAVVDKNVNTVNNYKTKLNETEAQLSKIEGELKRTSDALDKQSNKWLTAGESLKQAGDKLKNTGEKMSEVGGKLTKTVTLPIIAIGTAAVKSKIDFESAFAGVKKTVDGATEQLKALEDGIRNMTKDIPSSAEEISAVAEAAGQLGIQTDNVIGFTRTIIDLGNSTNLVGEEGASQLAKFANITRMSQKDFDRLGSTIVALGNNMATTEADIVSMAMRLAGAGKQVGMTESDIMSFSAALSSVGIEAEAGGSAFSKVMLEMQTQIQTNGKQLDKFAKVAGMTTKEFSKAFKEDATGALIAFIEGLGKLDNKAIVLEELKLSELRVRDALLRASGAGDLFAKSIQIGSEAWKENTALTNEASQRYATTESQIKILRNEIVDLARDIGEDLLPAAKDGLLIVKDVIGKLKELSPETRENIIKFAALAAVTGPVIGGVGKVATGLGGLIGLAGKVSSALGGATTATATVGTAAASAGGATGIGALASGLGKVVLTSTPYVAAGAAIAGAGYAIYKTFSTDVIPTVDLFADKIDTTAVTVKNSAGQMEQAYAQTTTKISEETKKAVGAYIELDEKATASLTNLYTSTSVITKENADVLISTYSNMTEQINVGLDKSHNERLNSLRDFFANSTALSEKEETDILTRQNNHNEELKASNEEYHRKIKEILERAIAEKRTLRKSEMEEIQMYQDNMRENAVKTLSKEEVETKVIMERLKLYKGRITAEQASQVIANAEKQRLEAVSKAEQQYNETIAQIIRMRDETGTITAEQADKLILEAERQKEQSIIKADFMKQGVVNKIKEMNGDIIKDIDETDGSIKSRWDKLKEWFTNNPIIRMIKTVGGMDALAGANNTIGGQALGTNYFQGGLTYINERGYELVDLPRGTKIRNHESSEVIVRRTAEETARAFMKNFNGQGITVNNYSPKALSEAESARQFGKVQRKISLGII